MNRDQIVDAARRLVEQDGVDALSMRKLAAELGVAVTSIYWHVGGREQLLGSLVDDLITEMTEIAPAGLTAEARIASIARGIRNRVREHPFLVDLARQLGRGPAAYMPGQVALAREVTAAGLMGREAALAVRAVLFLVGGFVMVEGAATEIEGGPTSQQLWEGVADDAIDPGLLSAMRRPPDIDELFEHALARLLPTLLRSPPVPAMSTKRRRR
jgi:AcrR family transcriptional regulator